MIRKTWELTHEQDDPDPKPEVDENSFAHVKVPERPARSVSVSKDTAAFAPVYENLAETIVGGASVSAEDEISTCGASNSRPSYCGSSLETVWVSKFTMYVVLGITTDTRTLCGVSQLEES